MMKGVPESLRLAQAEADGQKQTSEELKR